MYVYFEDFFFNFSFYFGSWDGYYIKEKNMVMLSLMNPIRDEASFEYIISSNKKIKTSFFYFEFVYY